RNESTALGRSVTITGGLNRFYGAPTFTLISRCDLQPECILMDMPEEDKNMLTFSNHHKQQPTPFVIYADFEALTIKVEGPELDPTENNTRRRQHNEACSYCYIVVRCDGHTEPSIEYRGPNAAEHILKAL
ncbi:MAG: hypothetical protein AB2556_16925, partial [Candidatus Thiodiazotropha sp.]